MAIRGSFSSRESPALVGHQPRMHKMRAKPSGFLTIIHTSHIQRISNHDHIHCCRRSPLCPSWSRLSLPRPRPHVLAGRVQRSSPGTRAVSLLKQRSE